MTSTTETPEKLTVSVAEASIISGFSRVVIRTAIKRGELKSLLPHGYVRGRRTSRRLNFLNGCVRWRFKS